MTSSRSHSISNDRQPCGFVNRVASRRRALGAVLVVTLLGVNACGSSSGSNSASTAPARVAQAAFPLTAVSGTGQSETSLTRRAGHATRVLDPAYGAADLTLRGDRLTGFVTAWGLTPNTHYAVQLSGPGRACPSSPATSLRTTIALPDLASNAGGIALVHLDLTVQHDVVARGYYITASYRGSARATVDAASRRRATLCGSVRGT